jgi:hypothetical protein
MRMTLKHPNAKPLLVIDGNNVILHTRNSVNGGTLGNLNRLIEKCSKEGYDCLPLVSAKLKYTIDNPKQLLDSINQGTIIETPAGTDSDLFILETTKLFQAFVVSNDLFREYREQYYEVLKRRVPFLIIRNKVIIPSLDIA